MTPMPGPATLGASVATALALSLGGFYGWTGRNPGPVPPNATEVDAGVELANASEPPAASPEPMQPSSGPPQVIVNETVIINKAVGWAAMPPVRDWGGGDAWKHLPRAEFLGAAFAFDVVLVALLFLWRVLRGKQADDSAALETTTERDADAKAASPTTPEAKEERPAEEPSKTEERPAEEPSKTEAQWEAGPSEDHGSGDRPE